MQTSNNVEARKDYLAKYMGIGGCPSGTEDTGLNPSRGQAELGRRAQGVPNTVLRARLIML